MLYAYLGDVRSGKTLRMTIKAFKYARRFPNRHIYSNYWLNPKYFPNYINLTPEMLDAIDEDCLVLLDEIYAWIESRTSGKDINKYMSYIMFQSGKKGMDFIITAQLESTYDLRYRAMTNSQTECKKITTRHGNRNDPKNIIGFIYSTQKISREGRFKPKLSFLPIKKALKYFPMYNTKQKINPIDKSLIMNVSTDMTSIIKDIDIHCDKLIKKFGIDNIKKSVVRDYCLRNDLPKRYADSIFDTVDARRAKSS